MFLTLDFETMYDKDYSLKKMTTEAYIRDKRFYVHGVGLKADDRPTVYIEDKDVARILAQIPWPSVYLLCHNTRFDASILSWRYGFRPAFLLDTMSMARAVFPHESLSLANLSVLCGLGKKGDELADFMGVKRLSPEQQKQMGEYCKNDVELTYDLFQVLKKDFPPSELRVIDNTLRMFTEPILELDREVLLKHKAELEVKREGFLKGRDLTALRSNPQFAKLLEEYGVEPPMKISARTKKPAFAFSKTDEGMLALLEHENVEVQELVAARLGVKSSIELSRTSAFLDIASRGNLPIPLNYFGAQNTGRFSGSDGVNPQNLPRGGSLRKSIIAPDGHVLVVSDFNAIEARVISWLAGEEELLKVFRDGGDPYCAFASKVYGREITKAEKAARFLGKVCVLGLGYSLGWRKFASILAVGPLGQPPIIFTEADLYAMGGKVIDLDTKNITTKLTGDALQIHCSAAKHLVDMYRGTYDRVPAYWKTCGKMLQAMFRGVRHQFGVLSTEKDKILLPNGLFLQYKGLHADEDDNWRYYGKRGEKQYIYDGKLAENITQAIARIVMTDAQVEISKRYRVCATVHDEIVCCVKEEESEEALKFMLEVMHRTPAWAEGLPVAAEGGISTSYGGAK